MAELKRPLYFTGQLLVQGDFQDEQGYHVRLRRLHNSLLHTAGVMTGLDVAKKAGTKILTVQPGVAIDGEGREIVVDVTAKTPELDLNQRPLGPGFLIIKWVEVDTDPYTGTGPANTPTRKTVRPELDWVASVPDGADKLASGNNLANDVTFDSSIRSRAASVTDPAGTLVTRTLKLSIPNSPEAQWPSLSASAANTVSLAGSLSVTGALSVTGGASVSGALSVAATANVTGNASVGGKFGIGTTNPQSSLDIATGGIHVGGSTSQTIPNVQGAHISWNRTNGIGETDFINHRGSGPAPGGFAFLNTNDGAAISSLMFIAGSGNIGIGTTAPLTQLHIRKDANAALGPVLTLMNGIGNAGAGAAIDFDGYDTAANPPTLRLQSIDDGQGSSHLAISTKRPGQQTNPLEERVRITSAGNVGIGIPAPEGRLQILNSAQDANGTTLIIGPTTGANLRLGYHTDYSWIQSHGNKPLQINPLANSVGVGPVVMPGLQGRFMVSGGGAEVGFIRRNLTAWPAQPVAGDRFLWYNQDGSSARLWTEGTGGDLLAVGATGNVGIGTVAQTEKLHIEAGSAFVNGENQGLIIDESGRKRTGLMKYPGKEMMLIGDSALPTPVRLGRWTGGTIKNPTSVFEDLIISSSGNVGIGTGGAAQPAAKLQVAGGAIMPAVGNSAQAGIQFPSDPGGGGGDEAF